MSTHLLTSLAGPTWCGIRLYRWLLCANPCCPAPSFFVVYQEWLFAEGADIRKHSPAADKITHDDEGTQHQWKHKIFKIHYVSLTRVNICAFITCEDIILSDKVHHTSLKNFILCTVSCHTVRLKKACILLQLDRHSKIDVKNVYNIQVWIYCLRKKWAQLLYLLSHTPHTNLNITQSHSMI